MNPLSSVGGGGAFDGAIAALRDGANAARGADTGGAAASASDSSTRSFKDALVEAVSDTNRLQQDADGVVKKFATGDIDDVHQVMLAMNRADLSFRMMLEVRNKLVDAYQEVMRMQV